MLLVAVVRFYSIQYTRFIFWYFLYWIMSLLHKFKQNFNIYLNVTFKFSTEEYSQIIAYFRVIYPWPWLWLEELLLWEMNYQLNNNWNDGSLRKSGQQVNDDRKSSGDDEFKVRQSTEKRENVNVKKMKVASDWDERL